MAEQAIVKATESAAIELSPVTIKRYVNQYASDQEIALFLNQCKMFGLNPFKREIYLIKYSANQPATFVVGYEVYLKRAERTEKWDGFESGTDGKDGDLKAWVKVYRKDWSKPLYHEVYYEEYAQFKDEYQDGKKTGQKTLTRFWAEKPRTMLKKVAISQAFRMAFPDEFAGMPYTMEEMPVDHAKLPTAEIKAEPVNNTPVVDAEEEAAPAKGKFDFLSDFTGAKKNLGDKAYYNVLGSLGYEHANQIPVESRKSILNMLRSEYKKRHTLVEEREPGAEG